jgi:hypothetical protein
MNTLRRAAGFSRPQLRRQILFCFLSLALLFATGHQNLLAYPAAQAPAQAEQAPPYMQQTPEQLQQLVAPIALYPDELVAQILAASTFPEQVVQADRWVQEHPDLQGEALARAADQQPWDASVKALTAFPSVLGNMDKNLSWTSSLGDAYYNQGQDVMDAVQVMRQRAEAAGTLKTTPQQTVIRQGSTIIIQSAYPDVVYVPAYDPWLVYGYPIVAWPGWYPYPGIWFGGPYPSFGISFRIGFFGGFGWGWPYWGCNWGSRFVVFNHNRYFSRSTTFYNRNNFYRGGGGVRGGLGGRINGNVAGRGRVGAGGAGNIGGRAGVYNRPGATTRPFNGDSRAARGYAAPRGRSGIRSGVFDGYGRGGQARSFSSRGSASFGGAARGGGGGTRGGGARGGGGGRR